MVADQLINMAALFALGGESITILAALFFITCKSFKSPVSILPNRGRQYTRILLESPSVIVFFIEYGARNFNFVNPTTYQSLSQLFQKQRNLLLPLKIYLNVATK